MLQHAPVIVNEDLQLINSDDGKWAMQTFVCFAIHPYTITKVKGDIKSNRCAAVQGLQNTLTGFFWFHYGASQFKCA